MKKIFFSLICAGLLCSCEDDPKKEVKVNATTVPENTLESPSKEVPQKVTGVFLGSMPCNDCKLLDRMINLQENYYTIQEHHRGTTDKMKLLVQYTGKCMQDSGRVNLYDSAGKMIQNYRISSMDTLLLISKAKNSRIPQITFSFVRKDGKKITQ
jgi:hypothetical protein